MIQANEIRIGNKVNFGVVMVTIRGIHTQRVSEPENIREHFYVSDFVQFSNYYTVEPSNLTPIPLTIELLIKCGFNLNEDAGNWHSPEHTIYSTKNFSIGIKGNYIGWYNHCEDDFYSSFYPELKYLHQLQNLYFALTQTELEIKL